jgi:glycosyltransferase involved in cell wall biosynthesis
MTRKITPLRDLISLVKLVRLIKKFKPDIVHTHTPKAGLLGMLAAWFCRVPLRFHTVAGLPLIEAKGFKKKLLIAAEQITYACTTHLYSNSSGLREYIRKFISDRIPVRMIGQGSTNGINTNHFSRTTSLEETATKLRLQHGISKHDVVLSFAGRIVKDKGIREIIEAFKMLNEHTKESRLFLLLIGPFEHDLDPLSAADRDYLDRSQNIVLPGFQSDVRPWMATSDIFVFPSYREGFPNVVLQACALEVPCVVSDINGCNEIIQHGITGLIVKPKDVGTLFTALETLINDPQKRRSMGSLARDYVVKNFDQQYIWQAMLKEYQEALKLV